MNVFNAHEIEPSSNLIAASKNTIPKNSLAVKSNNPPTGATTTEINEAAANSVNRPEKTLNLADDKVRNNLIDPSITHSQEAQWTKVIYLQPGDYIATSRLKPSPLNLEPRTADGAAISTLSGPLKLQENALGPLEIMAGRVVIDTEGNLKVEGDVEIRGRLEVKGAAKFSRGITLIDEETGEEYCVRIKAGKLTETKGACAEISPTLSPSPTVLPTLSPTPSSAPSP